MKARKLFSIVAYCSLIVCCAACSTQRQRVNPAFKVAVDIDFSMIEGQIKALHGVNNGPFNFGAHMAPISFYHAAAGFPHTRLHDVNWPNSEAIDIHAVFPLFHLDPDDPANYDFTKSDDYIRAIVKNNSQIIYRLGESIEHKTAYYIHPPADFEKWAKICVNIIRHYNEGWNNGFHYNIKYWEVWNEPENENMWRGTHEQYFKLYETTARAIKRYDQTLKVGGPGAVGESSDFVNAMLTYCRDNEVPLDFFSWHFYSNDPFDMAKHAKIARRNLDEFGFEKTESHLNEWHYLNGWDIFPGVETEAELPRYNDVRKNFERTVSVEGAAMAATTFIALQDSYVDVANYYCADYYNPLSMFDSHGIPSKVYFAFKAFNQLMETPLRVSTTVLTNDTTATLLAGVSEDKQRATVFISNFASQDKRYRIALKNFSAARELGVEVYMVDQHRDLTLNGGKKTIGTNSTLDLMIPAYSVGLIKLAETNAENIHD